MPKCKSKSIDAAIVGGKVKETFNKWMKDPAIQALTQGDVKYWKSFYETHMELDHDFGRLPTIKEAKKLDIKLNRMIKDVKRKPGKMAEWLYLPENILSKNPVTKKYFDSLIFSGNFYRGHLEMFTSDIDQMARMIRDTAREDGTMRLFNLNRPSAQKQIKKLEARHDELLIEDPNEARKFWKEKMQRMDATEEQRVVQAVYDLISDPNRLYIKAGEAESLSKKYGTAAVEIARIWTGDKGGGDYTLSDGTKGGMRDKLWETLDNGLSSYVRTLRAHGAWTGTMDRTDRKIERVLEQFRKQKNFYPTRALDIFPTLNKLSETIYSTKDSNALKDALPSINTMLDKIVDDLRLDPHTYLSSGDVKHRSKDVISVIDQYAKDVIRFNYTAHATENVTSALRELSKQQKDPVLKEQADFLSKYIQETHSTVIGNRNKGSKLAHFARAITSWQFMQKIGLSPGTVVRNATQSLQNWVWFGGKSWKDAMQYKKSFGLGGEIREEMQKHGVFFVNLEEIAETGDMLGKSQLIDGKVVHSEPGFTDWFNNAVEKAAKITGKPMQFVENEINRSLTFNIAYVQMHKDLTNNHDLIYQHMIRKFQADNPSMAKQFQKAALREAPWSKDITKAVNDEIRNRSSRYAANMVKEIHYEYNAFAKPKLIQTPAGSIAGQFSTYSINFYEYNRKIAQNAKDSMMAGDWNSKESWRAYRLGMLYAFTTGLLEPLTNAKWGNLIEHDTADRLSQLFTWLTGNEAEKKRTFYGKGPILGTFGGPFINDVVTVGNMMGLSNLADGEFMSYLGVYKQKAKDIEDRRLRDAVGLLNQTAAKFIFSSAPKLRDGTGFMTILAQDYLQLWNTPEIKARREKMMLYPQKYGPELIGSSFKTRKQRELAEKRRLASWGLTSKEQTLGIQSKTSENRADVLRSLDLLSEGGDFWGR